MASLADAGLWLVRVFPFGAAAIVVWMGVRALRRGELMAGKRVRLVVKSRQPGDYWMQIVLHGVAAVFLFALGLLLTDNAPPWLVAWFEAWFDAGA